MNIFQRILNPDNDPPKPEPKPEPEEPIVRLHVNRCIFSPSGVPYATAKASNGSTTLSVRRYPKNTFLAIEAQEPIDRDPFGNCTAVIARIPNNFFMAKTATELFRPFISEEEADALIMALEIGCAQIFLK